MFDDGPPRGGRPRVGEPLRNGFVTGYEQHMHDAIVAHTSGSGGTRAAPERPTGI